MKLFFLPLLVYFISCSLGATISVGSPLPGVTQTAAAWVVRLQTYATQTYATATATPTEDSATLFKFIDTPVEENDIDPSVNSTENICYTSTIIPHTFYQSKLQNLYGVAGYFGSQYELAFKSNPTDVSGGPAGFSLVSGQYVAFGQDTDFWICGIVEQDDGIWGKVYHKDLTTTGGCVEGKIRVFHTTVACHKK